MLRIEIIAIGKDKIYSVGYVNVSMIGDVYHINKMGGSDMHMSRHVDGNTHYKSRQNDFCHKIRKGVPIEEFKGIEFLETVAFGLESLNELYKEYKLKKCDGIFAIDMRAYKDSNFNMSIAILTEEGLPKLYDSWKTMKKRQIYLFTDSKPMIAISTCDAKKHCNNNASEGS